MAKKTLDVADQEVSFTPEFLHIPSIVAFDKDLQPLDKLVYAVVFWFERLKDGRCFASNGTIGNVAGASASGVSHSLGRLSGKGYVTCIMDDKNQRKEIRTLVFNQFNPSSNEQGGVAQMSNIDTNTKTKYSPDELTNIKKVYVAWLKLMVLTPEQRSLTDTELRSTALKAASNRCRLTDQRKVKINARVRSLGLEQTMRAVAGLSESDWHRGENDNNWTASLEWLMKSDEKVEEWANKFGGNHHE